MMKAAPPGKAGVEEEMAQSRRLVVLLILVTFTGFGVVSEAVQRPA